MEKAYIILAHKNETQLKRLIHRLNDGMSSFFIHIDKNSALQDSKDAFKDLPKTQVVPSVKTEWGNFGLVEATLNAMQAVKDSGKYFDRIILLSGQDYPIKSNEYINDFFKSSEHSVFMDHYTLPDFKKWANGGAYRVNKYFFGLSTAEKYAAKTMNFLSTYIKPMQRKLKTDMQHYYGSQWWVIDGYTLDYILNFVRTKPEYVAFHKHTFAPDEIFFQTILMNTGNEELSGKILNDHVRFMRWPDGSSAHPEILIKDDLNNICTSKALFARKFDTNTDAAILDLIDEKCLNYN